MSDKFGDNLCWFLTQVAALSESDLEFAGAVVEIVGENESGAEGRTEVSVPELCGEAAEKIKLLQDNVKNLVRHADSLREQLEDSESFAREMQEQWDAG